MEYIKPELIELFGGEDQFMALPVLDISDRTYFTEYIDFIRYDDMTHPIMRGVDKYERAFVAFKLQFVTPTETKKITVVLFQRYSDASTWCTASNPCGAHDVLFDGLVIQHPKQYEMIQTLVNNKRLDTITNYYYHLTGDYVLG